MITKSVLIGLAALVCIICFYSLSMSGQFSISRNYNFGGDGAIEKINLRDNKLQIFQNHSQMFRSEKDYEVNDFDIGDINNDGEIELVIGFWRFGDFGRELDYQQARRDPKKSYHLYIYKYSEMGNNFYLVWGSSTLPHPIFDFDIIMEDGQNVLAVDEGTYEDYDKNGEIKPVKTSFWTWNEWWFEEY